MVTVFEKWYHIKFVNAAMATGFIGKTAEQTKTESRFPLSVYTQKKKISMFTQQEHPCYPARTQVAGTG